MFLKLEIQLKTLLVCFLLLRRVFLGFPSRPVSICRAEWRTASLFLSPILTHSRILRSLFSYIHLRCLHQMFDHNVLINTLLLDEIYPPLGVSIWLNITRLHAHYWTKTSKKLFNQALCFHPYAVTFIDQIPWLL